MSKILVGEGSSAPARNARELACELEGEVAGERERERERRGGTFCDRYGGVEDFDLPL